MLGSSESAPDAGRWEHRRLNGLKKPRSCWPAGYQVKVTSRARNPRSRGAAARRQVGHARRGAEVIQSVRLVELPPPVRVRPCPIRHARPGLGPRTAGGPACCNRPSPDKVATAGHLCRSSYTYDFGDNWEHQVTVEKVLEGDPSVLAGVCRRRPLLHHPRLRRSVGKEPSLLSPIPPPRDPERAEWASAWAVRTRSRGVRPEPVRRQSADPPPRGYED